MKYIIPLIFLASIIYSCGPVYFIQPQPKGGKPLSTVPQELHGTWYNEYGRISINEKGVEDFQFERDTNNIIIDTTKFSFNISDSILLFKAHDLYVVNVKNPRDQWEIAVLKKLRNGDIHKYSNFDPLFFQKDPTLKLIEAKFGIDGNDTIIHHLNPDFDQNLRFDYAIFSGQMKIKTIRKMVKPENLSMIYKANGTMFSPSDTIN